MGTRDSRIDAYIAKSPEFARPILTHIRAVVHEACPDVVETIKWSVPHFEQHGALCAMAAFKAHCMFGFFKGSLDSGKKDPIRTRIETLADLPPRAKLKRLIQDAAKLNEAGIKMTSNRRATPRPPVEVPDDFLAAVRKNKKALSAFTSFPPSHKREYVEWITGAKGEDTRKRRLATAVEWIAEGKSRNWKYEPK